VFELQGVINFSLRLVRVDLIFLTINYWVYNKIKKLYFLILVNKIVWLRTVEVCAYTL